jgi:hypothetical protein
MRWKRLPRRPRWAWENSSVYFFAVPLTDSAVARSGKHNTLLGFTFFAPARLEWSLGRQVLIPVHCNCITHYGVLNIAVLNNTATSELLLASCKSISSLWDRSKPERSDGLGMRHARTGSEQGVLVRQPGGMRQLRKRRRKGRIILILILLKMVGRDSVVGIATCYGLDVLGIKWRWERDFPHPPRQSLGPNQPPIQWVQGPARG